MFQSHRSNRQFDVQHDYYVLNRQETTYNISKHNTVLLRHEICIIKSASRLHLNVEEPEETIYLRIRAVELKFCGNIYEYFRNIALA